MHAATVLVAALFVATGLWTMVTGTRGHPIPVVVVVLASGGALFLARVASGRIRIAVPATVLAAAAIAAIAGGGSCSIPRRSAGPSGTRTPRARSSWSPPSRD